MSIFAGEHGARTSVRADPRTAVSWALGYFEQSLPSGILRTLGIATLWDAWVKVFLLDTRIEARDDIDGRGVGNLLSLTRIVTLCTFIVNGTCGVELVQPGGHSSLVRTIATLVAQTPKDDAGVVLVALCHADGSIQEGIAPVGRRGQCATKPVRLAIGLVHHIHAHRVAKLIPTGTVRIVRQSYGVDVGLLHQSQVLKHALLRHNTGGIRVVLVAIDTPNLDRLAVDEQLAVLDMDGAKTYLLGHLLNDSTIGVLQLQAEGVEVRVLHTPQLRTGNLHLHAVELAMSSLRKPLVHAGCLVLEV